MSLGQQTALDPPFGPVGGIGPGFFPLPAGPWSARHPCSATASQSPAGHRTVPPPPATTSETPPPLPRPGTDHGPWNGDTSPWHLRLPTDSPCARPKRWRRHTADPRPGGDRHQTDGCSDALALPPSVPPRVRPRPESWPSLGSRLPGGVSASWLLECSAASTYHRLVIRIATKAFSWGFARAPSQLALVTGSWWTGQASTRHPSPFCSCVLHPAKAPGSRSHERFLPRGSQQWCGQQSPAADYHKARSSEPVLQRHLSKLSTQTLLLLHGPSESKLNLPWPSGISGRWLAG